MAYVNACHVGQWSVYAGQYPLAYEFHIRCIHETNTKVNTVAKFMAGKLIFDNMQCSH